MSLILNRSKKAKPLTKIEEHAVVLLEKWHLKVVPNVIYNIYECGCVGNADFGISIMLKNGHKRICCPDCREAIITKYKKCVTCGIEWIGKSLRVSPSGYCMECYNRSLQKHDTGGLGNRNRNSIPYSSADRIVRNAPRVSIHPEREKPKAFKCVHARICGDSCMVERGEDCSMYEPVKKTHLWY